MQEIRRELSKESNPPIEKVINSNIIPVLMQMSYQRNEKFAFEVCWILCNIASGTSKQVEYLFNLNSLEFFLKIFDSNPNNLELRDQIVWAVGNVSGDCNQFRDLINKSGLFDRILQYGYMIVAEGKSKHVANCMWAVSNFARGKPPPREEILAHLDDFFVLNLPRVADKNDVLQDMLWGMVYTTESIKRFDKYTESVLKIIFDLIQTDNNKLELPLLRIIGNFVSNCNNSWCRIRKFNCIQILMNYLNHSKATLRKEVIWVFSNLVSETSEVVSEMINLQIYPKFLAMITSDTEPIRNEIIWTISNSYMSSQESQAKALNQMNWIDVYMNSLENFKDNKVKMVILEGMYEALSKDKDSLKNELKERLEGYLERFNENLQMKKKIEKILELFEDLDDEQNEDVHMDMDMDN